MFPQWRWHRPTPTHARAASPEDHRRQSDLTNPPYRDGIHLQMQRLVIAKVQTSEPGLYGLGCASFVFAPARSSRSSRST